MSTRYTNFSEIIIKHLSNIKHFTYYDNYLKKKKMKMKSYRGKANIFFVLYNHIYRKKQQHWIVRKIG